MIEQVTDKPEPTIEEVRVQFETWRSTRNSRQPIPDQLWQAAFKLSKNYSIYKIALRLRIDLLRFHGRFVQSLWVGRLVDTGIQYGQNFREQLIIAMFDSLGATRAKINRFNLLNHNETCQLTVFRNRDVKGETTLCVRNRTHDSKPVLRLNRSLLTTKAGCRPFCS